MSVRDIFIFFANLLLALFPPYLQSAYLIVVCCFFSFSFVCPGMPRHHPGPDMPNFYSLSPGGVGQLTSQLGWWVTGRLKKKSARLIHAKRDQKLCSVFTSYGQWHCTGFVYWIEKYWPGTAASSGRSASGGLCCAAVATATPLDCVPSTCQTHRRIRAPA